MTEPAPRPPGDRYRWIRIVAGVASLIAFVLILRALPVESLRSGLQDFLRSLGPWGPVAFVLIYIVATIAMLPASMLTLLGAAVFGLVVGYVTVAIGSVVGASCAFLIARYVARSRVEQLAAKHPKFDAIDQAISEGGWKVVALLRLSPAIPFNLQNYLYGLTSIRFWPYVITSWLAMIPGTLMYVYLGHAAGQAVGNRSKTPGEWALLIVGLIATIAVTVYVTRLAKSKLDEKASLGETPEETRPPAGFPVRLVVIAIVLVALATASTIYRPAIADYAEKLAAPASTTD